MEVTLLEPFGYCFGVKNGLKQLETIKNNNFGYKIHILGPFVHNSYTNEQLINQGFIIFKSTILKDQIKYIKTLSKDNDIVVFALHGHYKEVLDLLNELNIKYFDISCHFIKHNLDIVQNNPSNQYFIVGDANHIEIKYLTSFLNFNYILNDYSKLSVNTPYTLLNQTTTEETKLNEALDNLKKYDIDFSNKNLCIAPYERYSIFKKHLENNIYDYVFIIGDKTSANTNNLLNIYYLSTKLDNIGIFTTLEEIKSLDLNKYKKVLVLSGTSSDNEVILSIYNYLKTI